MFSQKGNSNLLLTNIQLLIRNTNTKVSEIKLKMKDYSPLVNALLPDFIVYFKNANNFEFLVPKKDVHC